MNKISVVIIDDQKLFAQSLKNVIESRSENIQIIKVLYDGQSGLEYLQKVQPDLLLLDIQLPDINGVDIAKYIRDHYPTVKVLMLTTFDDEDYIQGALANGAGGYLLKDIEPENLISAINVVLTGNILVSPDAMNKLVKRVKKLEPFQLHYNVTFNRREEEVVTQILEGLSNQEISDRLNIAEQTVKNILTIVYEKCGVKNRLALVHLINNYFLTN